MPAVPFPYEVAISFLDGDESVARELASLLAPLPVFVYSEQQLAVAGTDGVETFSAVFRRDARIVVILYREGWGKTKWTRIEEEAIKSRYFDDGAEFLILVPLDRGEIPAWFPSTRIWIDLERFGIAGAASVIEERVKQAGGALRAETPQENAARLAVEMRAEAERVAFLKSEAGVNAANVAVETLFDRLAVLASESGIAFDREPGYALLYRDGFSVAVSWSYSYRNTLDESALYIIEWSGRPDIGAKRFHSPTRKEINRHQYTFDTTDSRDPVWQGVGVTRRRFSTSGLADHCATLLIDRIRDEGRRSRR